MMALAQRGLQRLLECAPWVQLSHRNYLLQRMDTRSPSRFRRHDRNHNRF